MVATVPEVLAALSGIIGEKIRRGLPDSDLGRRILRSAGDLRDMHGVSEEAMVNIVPESWRDKAFRPGEQDTSGQSIAEVLPAHDAETASSNKTQYRLGKLAIRVRYDRYVASLKQLPETTPPRGTGDPNVEKETRGFEKARQRNPSGPSANAFLRARPVDSSRVIPASEFVSAGRRFLGVEALLATRCPCCGATDANTRHARLYHRSGAQINHHQPLVHALFRTFNRMSIDHPGVDSGAPFNTHREWTWE